MVALLTRGAVRGPSATDLARPRASYRVDLVTALLGVWFTVGLFLDAWAHNNLTELETFFTPWHGVFYSGFVAVSAWIAWLVLGHLRVGRRGLAAVPIGYGLAVLGIPIFAVAGVGDMVWHLVFGIETDVDILFSPTHLALVTSMMLIVTAPLRSAWGDPSAVRPTVRRLLPALLSVAFATTLVLLFVQFANALAWGPGGVVGALSVASDDGIGDGPNPLRLVSSVAVTNVVLLAPLLLLARRWRVPAGAGSALLLAVAGLVGAITAFEYPSMLLMLVLAGVCVDGLLAWLAPGGGERKGRLLAFAGLAPLVVWSLYVGFASVDVGRLPSVVELWTGLPVAASLHGLLLGVLTAPHRVPAHAVVDGSMRKPST